MHWLACMTNSLGLVLTLVTLSSNCLKLTTSLLEGYINGQVEIGVRKADEIWILKSGWHLISPRLDGIPGTPSFPYPH